MSAPSRPKPMPRKPALGGASANLDRGLARQRLLMAAVALPVEAQLRRAIAPVQATAAGVHTGRVLRTAVTVATTPEAAPRRAIALARPTAVAVDTGQVLRTAAGVPIPAVGARITVAAAVAAVITVVEAEALFAPAAAAGVAVPAGAIANSL
jgi:hypothetical protein